MEDKHYCSLALDWNYEEGYMLAYGRKHQYAKPADKSPKLNLKGQRLVQSTQSEPTENTKKEAEWLMDFLAIHPNAKLCFFAGTMKLMVDSDATYLVLPRAKSRIAGHFYLAFLPNRRKYNNTPNNAPVLTECKILRHVVCSAAELKCAGLFHNGCTAKAIWNILSEMGHQQQPIHIKTDNKTTNSFVHASMHVQWSKSWDM
eukprot:10604833-Ditylum_brightwellii.AAC.1